MLSWQQLTVTKKAKKLFENAIQPSRPGRRFYDSVSPEHQVLNCYKDEKSIIDLNRERAIALKPDRLAFWSKGKKAALKQIKSLIGSKLNRNTLVSIEEKGKGNYKSLSFEKFIVKGADKIPILVSFLSPSLKLLAIRLQSM